ncbi:hypothetical protein FKR81_41805 [Lentzea tibetensis]|uniref:Uncharacterized protein n=1 Tax=Lentzea tibetensis TaxID=2591470 RepID=A0A563EEY8_9PSEU|nr:hypothetical protein [Lentzea tibetensis]TWP43974.1 hypothetical protein FKR81_41805 [Lentzea tibetensis]
MKYEDQVHQLRRMVAGLPIWRTEIRSGRTVVVDARSNEVLLHVEGEWTPHLVRFFDSFDRYSLLNLVSLLDALPMTHPEARQLLESLRLPEKV